MESRVPVAPSSSNRLDKLAEAENRVSVTFKKVAEVVENKTNGAGSTGNENRNKK